MKEDSRGVVAVAAGIQEANARGELGGCDHFLLLRDVKPSAKGCEDCLKMGDSWVNLRICLTCGYVGCCNDSKNKHATAHYHATAHPVIASYQEGENWLWCYDDEVTIEV